jgi:hypothetical protein
MSRITAHLRYAKTVQTATIKLEVPTGDDDDHENDVQ